MVNSFFILGNQICVNWNIAGCISNIFKVRAIIPHNIFIFKTIIYSNIVAGFFLRVFSSYITCTINVATNDCVSINAHHRVSTRSRKTSVPATENTKNVYFYREKGYLWTEPNDAANATFKDHQDMTSRRSHCTRICLCKFALQREYNTSKLNFYIF